MSQQNMLSTLLSRLHPRSCLQGTCGQLSNETYYQTDSSPCWAYNIPELLKDTQASSQEKQLVALKRLYELTGKRQHLR